MNKTITFILVIILLGCNPGHYERVRVNSGLSYRLNLENMIFLDASTAFMGASRSNEYEINGKLCVAEDYWDAQAYCLRSLDGGINWTHHYIAEGRNTQICLKDGILYANIAERENPGHFVGKLYVSRDQGLTWTWKGNMPGTFLNLHVMDSLWLFANNGYSLFETRDGGHNWKNVTTKNTYVIDLFHAGDYLCYFSSPRKYPVYNTFIRRNLHTGAEERVSLPGKYSGIGGCGDLIFCMNKRRTRVYKYDEDMTFREMNTFRSACFLKHVSRHGDQVILFINKIPPVLFQSSHVFLYSSNGGKTWQELPSRGCYSGEHVSSFSDASGFHVYFLISPDWIGHYHFRSKKHWF